MNNPRKSWGYARYLEKLGVHQVFGKLGGTRVIFDKLGGTAVILPLFNLTLLKL